MGDVVNADSTHHEVHCPKCKTENTQSIDVLVKANTQVMSMTTSTMGVGVGSSGGVGIGAGSSTTTGGSASMLAMELGKQYAYSEESNTTGKVIVAMLVLSMIVSYDLVSRFPSLFSKSIWVIAITGVSMFVALMTLTYSFFLKSLMEKDKAKNKKRLEQRETRERWITKGFFCHRCGHTFIPGSDEIYKPIEE